MRGRVLVGEPEAEAHDSFVVLESHRLGIGGFVFLGLGEGSSFRHRGEQTSRTEGVGAVEVAGSTAREPKNRLSASSQLTLTPV